MTFEQLSVGKLVLGQPRVPRCCLRTDTVREIRPGLGVTSLELGARFSFELTGNHGAALVTKSPTYSEDTTLANPFERYTKRHYESWVTFARSLGYGDDVRPVLVSGYDMTGDFAMVAYSYKDTSLESDLTTAVPMLIPVSPSIQGTWRTRYTPHTNYGPQDCIPPEQTIFTPPLQFAEEESTPSAFIQCVFIRYYSMDRGLLGLFPKVIRCS